jgi:hypothetical protein
MGKEENNASYFGLKKCNRRKRNGRHPRKAIPGDSKSVLVAENCAGESFYGLSC